MSNKSNNSCCSVGFLEVLTIVFIVLKLLGVITWSWWWVLAPIWISLLISLVILGIAIIIAVIFN